MTVMSTPAPLHGSGGAVPQPVRVNHAQPGPPGGGGDCLGDPARGQALVGCLDADEHAAVQRGGRPPVRQIGGDRLATSAGRGSRSRRFGLPKMMISPCRQPMSLVSRRPRSRSPGPRLAARPADPASRRGAVPHDHQARIIPAAGQHHGNGIDLRADIHVGQEAPP